jgi:oxygen-independent coproporphyrinogen-3 oxidase
VAADAFCLNQGSRGGVYSAVLPSHLYIHVPFCGRRCSYCDFSIAVRRVVPVAEYLEGIELELNGLGVRSFETSGSRSSTSSSLRPDSRATWTLDTVYLGGGTPSRLGGDGVKSLLGLVRERATLSNDAEITIEANPDDVSAEAVAAWASAGVNRVSLGAQSFNDDVLSWMHRTHSASRIAESFRLLRSGGIANLSLDLIFALPPEIDRSWTDDIDASIALEPEHLSLYGLTVEPATPLARWTAAGRVSQTSDEKYAGEFLEAHERLTSAGFDHYEVSNFARPSRASRHNSAYWTGEAYLGIGPSSHSYDGASRRWNIKPYGQWLRMLRAGHSVTEGTELIGPESASAERAYLGLRTNKGYRLPAADRPPVEEWVRAGWAAIDGDLVRLNAEGWLRLDSLAAGLTTS